MAHANDLYLGKAEYQVLGRRPLRHDGADKVTGKAAYTADVSMPNLAHGAFVRSPHAHARIKSIDVTAALAVPGVFAVATGDDFPDLDLRATAGPAILVYQSAVCGQPMDAEAIATRLTELLFAPLPVELSQPS